MRSTVTDEDPSAQEKAGTARRESLYNILNKVSASGFEAFRNICEFRHF